MYVKICGLRDSATAEHAAEAGADAVGVVMSPRSTRHATHEETRSVLDAVAGGPIDTVLVVNEMTAAEAARVARDLGFSVLQLHGDYTREDFDTARAILPRVWRATSLARHPRLRAGEHGEEHLLLDAAIPGSGEPWDTHELDRGRIGDSWLLAGGLTPENVARAITASDPWGVDVSSGVESSPGVKDLGLVSRFIDAARTAAVHSDIRPGP